MRISKLFTIPEGEKVTEQKLRSVLVASICSILLCMTCLASTTWAWFTVSVENTGNVIVPYSPQGAAWFSNGVEVSPGVTLTKGENVFIINHRSAADDLGRKCDLYVTFSVDSMAQNCIKLCKENNYSTAVTLIVSDDSGTHKVFWGDAQYAPPPDDITVNDSGTVEIKVEAFADDKSNAEAAPPSKGPPEGEGSGQNPSEETTEPAETTTPSDPSEETTQPTDPADSTDPTKATDPTDPTDPTKPTEPTEPEIPTNPTQPTEPTPTTEPTQPTVAPDSNESEKPAGEEPSGEA